MKKFYLVFAVAMLALAFASCQKDGQFKPKEKIRAVYRQGTISYDKEIYKDSDGECAKFLAEKWTWSDKKLKSIDRYNVDGSLNKTIQFTYDSKDRFDRIIYPSYQMQFNYDGSTLKSIDIYSGATIVESYTMTYDGKHISRIDYTNYNASTKKAASKFDEINPLSLLFGKEIAENMQTCAEMSNKNATRGISNGTYTLTWSGNNITHITYMEGSYQANSDLEYDKNKNPYKGCLTGVSPDFMSENNVVSMTANYRQGTYSIDQRITNQYNYSNKFPSMKTQIANKVDMDYYWYYINSDNNPEYYPSYTETIIETYEYE